MCDVFQPKIDLCKEFWRICKYGSAFTNIYYDQVNIWILHNSELDIKRPKNALKDQLRNIKLKNTVGKSHNLLKKISPVLWNNNYK